LPIDGKVSPRVHWRCWPIAIVQIGDFSRSAKPMSSGCRSGGHPIFTATTIQPRLDTRCCSYSQTESTKWGCSWLRCRPGHEPGDCFGDRQHLICAQTACGHPTTATRSVYDSHTDHHLFWETHHSPPAVRPQLSGYQMLEDVLGLTAVAQ